MYLIFLIKRNVCRSVLLLKLFVNTTDRHIYLAVQSLYIARIFYENTRNKITYGVLIKTHHTATTSSVIAGLNRLLYFCRDRRGEIACKRMSPLDSRRDNVSREIDRGQEKGRLHSYMKNHICIVYDWLLHFPANKLGMFDNEKRNIAYLPASREVLPRT